MGYEVPDTYNQPDQFGLVTIGQIDWSSGCYEFDIHAVWQHTDTGAFYWAEDSGCSCPTPFVDFTSLDELTPITDLDTFATELNNRNNNRRTYEQGPDYDRSVQVAELLERLHKAGLR